jgi:hypothetical protein
MRHPRRVVRHDLLRLHVALLGASLLLGCGPDPDSDPSRYRLTGSGEHWDVVGRDHVFDDLEPRYAAFFEVILDPASARMPDTRSVRDDLERTPVDRRNYDALNAVAIAYFEINYRAEQNRGALAYLGWSQNAAKLLAVPWRAYGETEDAGLRTAILDFFEDAGRGEKLMSAATAPRVARIVASLERKESDSVRRTRILELARDR